MASIILGTMTMGENYRPFVSHNANQDEHERMIALYVASNDAHHGRPIMDTARYYRNEAYLSSLNIPSEMNWASKANPWMDNDFSLGRFGGYRFLKDQIEASYQDCGMRRFDTYFLHAPDPDTPNEDIIDVMGEAFRKERFDRWGLSNFSLMQCQDIMRLCDERDAPLPSVYQGMLNVFCRRVEEILPLIRDYGMSFWAYNPLIGGLACRLPDPRNGRFANPIYRSLFMRPSMLKACSALISNGDGVRLALTWLRDQSMLTSDDAVILGASSIEQLRSNLNIWTDAPPQSFDEQTLINDAFWGIKDSPEYWY